MLRNIQKKEVHIQWQYKVFSHFYHFRIKKKLEMDDLLKTIENLQIDPYSQLGFLIGIAVVILTLSKPNTFDLIY